MPSGLPSLDIFSVKTMALTTILVVTLVTLLSWRINERIAGMSLFTIGLLSITLGGLTGIARILIHGNTIIVVFNVFAVGGMILISQSVRIFRGLPPLPRTAVVGLAAVVSLFQFWFLFVHDNFGMRVGVISTAMAFLSLDAAASMFRRVAPAERGIYWPTGCAFAFAASYLAIRSASALFGTYGADLWAPVPAELAATICANAACIWCVFGMVIASNAQLRRETEKMALIDPLTNLPNRRSFWDRLLEAEDRALATNQEFGLIYLDLDEFKLINDVLGHDAGDDLLKAISAAMTRMLRSGDCVGRIGGDEFVVLVEDVQNHGDVETLAARLKATVERERLPGHFGASVRVSCGIATFPSDGYSAHDAMRKADAAMYRAKHQSRIEGKTGLAGVERQFRDSATADIAGHNASIGTQPSAKVAGDVPFRRRRSDQSRKAPQPLKRRVWADSIWPTVRPAPAGQRTSWAKPLSWIGY
jgi:diguanylate cyclase (GGDEF)-like protein